MPEVLVDSDVFIDHLRGARELRPGSRTLCYSVVTRCELFAGQSADEPQVRDLLAAFREIRIDRAVAERAGRLRRQTGLRTPDALIAATALESDMGLMTRNSRDFMKVPGLRVVKTA